MGHKFVADYNITAEDINEWDHMGNERALLVFQHARILFLDSLGCSQMDLGNDIGIILGEAFVKFKKEVFLHDRLKVFITISDVKETSFLIKNSVIRENDDKEVFSGYTKVVAMDYSNKKVVSIPGEFLDKVENYIEK